MIPLTVYFYLYMFLHAYVPACICMSVPTYLPTYLCAYTLKYISNYVHKYESIHPADNETVVYVFVTTSLFMKWRLPGAISKTAM